MTRPDIQGDSTSDCSTSNSFADHGIDRGVRLVTRTHRRLRATDGMTFEPTDRFFDRLEEAFLWAYLGSVEEPGVPAHVEAAVDDAKATTAEEFRDRSGADLRTEVIPAFYRQAAGFHCAYRGAATGAGDASASDR